MFATFAQTHVKSSNKWDQNLISRWDHRLIMSSFSITLQVYELKWKKLKMMKMITFFIKL